MLSTRFNRASATLLPLLCLLITFWTPSTLAQDLPQRATVQRALDALGKSDTPTASQQADQKFLTDTLSLLDSIDKEKSKAKTQSERLRTLPAELKEIGAKLELSTETVRVHVRRIYSKLQVNGKMEALKKAYPQGYPKDGSA